MRAGKPVPIYDALEASDPFRKHTHAKPMETDISRASTRDDAIDALEALYRDGHIETVRQHLGQAVDQRADSPEVSRVLALLLSQWGDPPAALVLLESAAEAMPDNAVVHNDLGVMQYEQGRLPEAAKAFQQALACDPSFQPAMENLERVRVDALVATATAQWRFGNHDEARRRLQEALRLAPEHPQARQTLDEVNVDQHRRRIPQLVTDEPLAFNRLRHLFQEAILICALNRDDTERWWDGRGMHTVFHVNSAPVLRRLLSEYVMHRAGDYRAFLRLCHELEAIGGTLGVDDRFYVQVAERLAVDLRAINCLIRPPEYGTKKPFLLAFPVWGDAYVDRFLSCCLPSLLAAGNIPYLCERRTPYLLIHTDARGEQKIRAAAAMRKAVATGLELRFMPLDPEILGRIGEEENFKYWHLGLIQSLELAYARRLGADYHMLLPDMLYCADYFRNLLRAVDRGQSAILQATFRTDAARISAAIAEYTIDDVISVPAADLMAIALNCLHPSMNPLWMNRRPEGDSWPAFHALFWEEDSSLRMISPHQTPAYIDSTIIARLPDRFFFTLDSEIDKLLPPEVEVSSPTVDDELVLAEMSPVGDEAYPDRLIDTTAYLVMFWHRVENRRHLAHFGRETAFPINTALRHARQVVTTARTDAEMQHLRSLVADHYPLVPVQAMMSGMLSLQWAEKHPLAENRLAEIRAAARQLWESGKAAVGVASPADQMRHIVRSLWHFDLLPEAAECLDRYQPNAPMQATLTSWQRQRQDNADYARQLDLSAAAAAKACVIGATLWGDAYLEFFRDYHLPSLLADGNVPALARRGRVILSIVTNAAGKEFLAATEVVAALARIAAIHFTIVDRVPGGPRESVADAQWFYWHYGLLDHHHVYLARDLGASLIMMPPDTVISEFGYSTLAESVDAGYDCCTVACIEAYRDQVTPGLDALRFGPVLKADAASLAKLAVTYRTNYFRSLVVNEQQPLNAYPREFFWRVPGGYICHSLFMHPIILSSRVMSREFHPNHENVDWTLLPRAMQGDGRVDVLDDASRLFILHCSDKTPRENEMSEFTGIVSTPLIEYLLSVHQHDYPIHRRLFQRPQHFRVEDDAPVSGRYLPDVTALIAAFDATMPRAAQRQ